jgi:hypothetical protein
MAKSFPALLILVFFSRRTCGVGPCQRGRRTHPSTPTNSRPVLMKVTSSLARSEPQPSKVTGRPSAPDYYCPLRVASFQTARCAR